MFLLVRGAADSEQQAPQTTPLPGGPPRSWGTHSSTNSLFAFLETISRYAASEVNQTLEQNPLAAEQAGERANESRTPRSSYPELSARLSARGRGGSGEALHGRFFGAAPGEENVQRNLCVCFAALDAAGRLHSGGACLPYSSAVPRVPVRHRRPAERTLPLDSQAALSGGYKTLFSTTRPC